MTATFTFSICFCSLLVYNNYKGCIARCKLLHTNMHTQHVHALNTYAIHLPECAKERERTKEPRARSLVRSFLVFVVERTLITFIAWCLLKICIVFHIITVIGKKKLLDKEMRTGFVLTERRGGSTEGCCQPILK